MAEVTERDGTVASGDGAKLFWRSWEIERPKATFAVCHGLGEHAGRYARFAGAMAERGYSTFAVDLRGMGRSPGARGVVERWSDWVADFGALVSMVGEHPAAGEVIPLGHSFGGVVMLKAVLDGKVLAKRFALSNPGLRAKVKVPGWKLATGRMLSNVAPTLALSNDLDPSSISREPAVVEAYRTDPLVHDRVSTRLYTEWTAACDDVFRRAGEIRTPFWLIVGEADKLIDPDGSRELDRLAVNAPHTMKVYAGRYHEPFNDLGSEEVFDDLAAWASAAPATAAATV